MEFKIGDKVAIIQTMEKDEIIDWKEIPEYGCVKYKLKKTSGLFYEEDLIKII